MELDALLSCQSITLPHSDSSWEIILKCREWEEMRTTLTKSFWRASKQGDLLAEGAEIAGQGGGPWSRGWWLVLLLPGNPELQRATARKDVFLWAPGWNHSWDESD